MDNYVIADKNKSVWVYKDKSNSYSLTTDKNRALIFDDEPAANAVFKNNLSKFLKSKGVVVQKIANNVSVATTAPSQEFTGSKYIISVLSDAVAKLNCRHTTLVDELSKYDRQRSDIEHYIEFNSGKLNACDGYKAYKMLQDVLIERRKIKDELSMIQVVRDKMAFPEDIANINEKVQELESRRYVPRELPHLFEKKV